VGTILNDDPVAIHTIQGAGDSSPLDGSEVTTPANVVSAVGPEGFFIQTPDGLDDGNPDRASDHDGMVLFLDVGSVLFNDGFETGDTTRWSTTTPSVPPASATTGMPRLDEGPESTSLYRGV